MAAVNQICGSVGTASRALLSTLRALSYVSSRARASHCGEARDQKRKGCVKRFEEEQGKNWATVAQPRGTTAFYFQ
jgi:hypothetical protein